jgi:hypothetical protein
MRANVPTKLTAAHAIERIALIQREPFPMYAARLPMRRLLLAAALAAIGSAARQLSFAFRKGGRGSFLPN